MALDITSLIIGVLLGSVVDAFVTFYIEREGHSWNQKELRRLERKMDRIYKKLE